MTKYAKSLHWPSAIASAAVIGYTLRKEETILDYIAKK